MHLPISVVKFSLLKLKNGLGKVVLLGVPAYQF